MSQVNRRDVVFFQSPIESVGWEAKDYMTFSAASPPASLDSQTFKIDISYENTGPEHNTVLLANTGMTLIHGYANSTLLSHMFTCCDESAFAWSQVPW